MCYICSKRLWKYNSSNLVLIFISPTIHLPQSHKVKCLKIISLLTESVKNSHLDVYVLKLVSHYQVLHENLDHRSDQKALNVSLIQGILF